MGKYIRKSRTTSEVAVMDLSFGVRTRAKTLALRSQHHQLPPSSSPSVSGGGSAGGGYIQLRNRRLIKKPPPIQLHISKRQKQPSNNNPNKVATNPDNSNNNNHNNNNNNCDNRNNKNSISISNSSKSGSRIRVSTEFGQNGEEDDKTKESKELGIEEASFGDNIEPRERSTRESTPCSLIRDPDSIRTPGSTTRPSSADTNRRLQNSMRRHIPTSNEMNEFFDGAEEEQQKRFVEKYNFDPINDKPLPGRFEWEKLDP